MSYIRFGEDDSDVYMYGSDHGTECCGCKLNKTNLMMAFSNDSDVLKHLDEHKKAGHNIPDHVYKLFTEDKRKKDLPSINDVLGILKDDPKEIVG